MPGVSRGKGPARGRKRLNDNQNVGHSHNTKRMMTCSSNDQQTQHTQQDTQTNQLNDSWVDDVNSQSDQAQCGVCQKSIDVFQLSGDSLDFLCCSYCNISTHISCLGIGSVFDGILKDLLQLIGWQCSQVAHHCELPFANSRIPAHISKGRSRNSNHSTQHCRAKFRLWEARSRIHRRLPLNRSLHPINRPGQEVPMVSNLLNQTLLKDQYQGSHRVRMLVLSLEVNPPVRI